MEVGGGAGATGRVKEQACLQGGAPQWGKQARHAYMEEAAGIWGLGLWWSTSSWELGRSGFSEAAGAESALLAGRG